MEYIGYIQLLFALLAVLGMLYVELVNGRNRRHSDNYYNFKYNLFQINMGDSTGNQILEEMIRGCATFESLEEIYSGFKVKANSEQIKACDEQIATHKNLSEDVIVQKRLLYSPLIMIGVLSVFLLWEPLIKSVVYSSNITFLIGKGKIFITSAITFGIVFSLLCISVIINYPYTGSWRMILKKLALVK